MYSYPRFLENLTLPNQQPWIGENYKSQKEPTLLIGRYFYGDWPQTNPIFNSLSNAATICVQNRIDHGEESTRFYSAIERILNTHYRQNPTREYFWNQYSFLNAYAGSSASDKITDEEASLMYQEGSKTILDRIKLLPIKPKRIICFGKHPWRTLENAAKSQNIWKVVGEFGEKNKNYSAHLFLVPDQEPIKILQTYGTGFRVTEEKRQASLKWFFNN